MVSSGVNYMVVGTLDKAVGSSDLTGVWTIGAVGTSIFGGGVVRAPEEVGSEAEHKWALVFLLMLGGSLFFARTLSPLAL